MNVYVLVPSQPSKVPPVTGADGVSAFPQLSETDGGVGVVANAIQATVDPAFEGRVKSSLSMV